MMHGERTAMHRALCALSAKFGFDQGGGAVTRVDVTARGGLTLETRVQAHSRWFAYSDGRLEELRPASDSCVPLARVLGEEYAEQYALLSYRPGRRLVLRRTDDSGAAVIKGYRGTHLAPSRTRHEVARRLLAAAELRVPELLDTDPRCASLSTAHHDGTALEISVNHEHLFALIGDSLRHLQESRVPLGLERHDVGDELVVLDARARRCQLAANALPQGWTAGRERLQKAAATMPAPHYGPAHRDLHDGQFIVTGDVVSLIDFDLLCQADVALDVGNLLAHLGLRALQDAAAIGEDDTHVCGRALLDGLARHSSADFWRRLRFFQAAAFLRLALIYFLRPRWHSLAVPLVTLGERCLRDYERLEVSK